MKEIKILIGGQEYGYSFNTFAITKLAELVGSTPQECFQKLLAMASNDIGTMITYVIYAGIVGYEKSKGVFTNNTPITVISNHIAEPIPDQFNKMWTICRETLGIPAMA